MKNYITMQEILIGNENKDFNNIFIYLCKRHHSSLKFLSLFKSDGQ